MPDDLGQYQPVSLTTMVRGLTGMMSYYAFIGILLGLFACCVGVPLAAARPYVGSYDRHGQALDITADGHGEYRSRTYTSCDEDPQEPCEKVPGDMPVRIPFTVAQSGTGIVARTSAGASPIRLIKPGIVEYDSLVFCESAVIAPDDPAAEECGA